MTELEHQLELLGREVAYPPTPDVARNVARRLGTGPAPRHGRRLSPRAAWAVAVAAGLLLAAGAIAAVPPARDALLDLVGLKGVTVERVPRRPRAPVGGRLDLGEPSSLPQAREQLGFSPLVPARLSDPDLVFVRRGPPGGELSLVYRPRPGLPRTPATDVGLLVGEFRGDLNPELVGKVVGPGTRLDRLTVAGDPAVWIAGAPHEVFYRGPNGAIRPTTIRLAGNVLLLQRGGRLIRLEGAFGLQTAGRIARSLRSAL
jgi:hypothetical protein